MKLFFPSNETKNKLCNKMVNFNFLLSFFKSYFTLNKNLTHFSFSNIFKAMLKIYLLSGVGKEPWNVCSSKLASAATSKDCRSSPLVEWSRLTGLLFRLDDILSFHFQLVIHLNNSGLIEAYLEKPIEIIKRRDKVHIKKILGY